MPYTNRLYWKATLAADLPRTLEVCIRYILYMYIGPKFDPEKVAANIAKHDLSLLE